MPEFLSHPVAQIGIAFLLFMAFKRLMSGKRISSAEAHTLVESGALLVDVRTMGEFGGGHLKGAKNIPVSDLGGRLKELPKDKTLVLYCRSGARSGQAVRFLKSQGYTELHNLGPMTAW